MKKKAKAGGPGEHPRRSKCPDNSAFYQQRIPAWTPALTAEPVLFIFFVIGIFCVAVGVAWIVSVINVKEIKINYSDACPQCSQLRENSSNYAKECTCIVNFTLQEAIQGDVFMYYGLDNFYQNHRRYAISRYEEQLLGQNVYTEEYNSTLDTKCAPFARYPDGTPMAPCGSIANSMFNDSILLYYYPDAAHTMTVPLVRNGNSWWSDKNVKFENPDPKGDLREAFKGTRPPPYWQKAVYSLDETDPENNGYKNDDLIIWMRVAAFPTFRKLYRRLSRAGIFVDGLPPGNYSYNIAYNFAISRFRGKKRVILSTMTWCGGRNMFLGIAYTATGAVTIVTAFIMLAIHLKLRKKQTYFQQSHQS
ncbi:cell cycle control protein 50C-like [Ambystoma mexicanum]|uniref:cell cycle control protein 50C-like n=1 Tax=Ambystoma mexicanum TaxID=8296 RepID=UPI0037E8FCD4